MGLDMYLSASKYLTSYDEEDQTLSEKIGKACKNAPGRINFITAEVGYWRKANHIHKWFVDNCQDGNDNCQEADVSKEQLQELLDLCLKVKKVARLVPGKVNGGMSIKGGVIEHHTTEGMVVENEDEVDDLLPTESGFFFGGTGYDEWYMKDIDDTIVILKKALEMPEGWYCSYRASW